MEASCELEYDALPLPPHSFLALINLMRQPILLQCFLIGYLWFGHTAAGAEETPQQWKVSELRFQNETLSDNPVDTPFSATFTSEAGHSITVPGFYDGDQTYCVRFTPSMSGQWNYTTTSTTDELNNQSGKLTVSPATDQLRGGIELDPNNDRQFQFQNGDRYFPIAFECDWLFALDGENADDIPKTRKFVDTLAENGFNQVVLNVFAYDVKWAKDDRLDAKYEYGSPKVYPFAGDNESPDHSKLNIEYFQRLDRVIEYLDQKGIAAHLMVYVWNKRVNWPEANSAADNRYFDYVVRRYQAYPNLIWDISKEALGYGHNDVKYIHGRIERLRDLDAYKRLITVHDYSYCRRFADKIDFVSVQLWQSELYHVMRDVCKNIPGKPILNIEHGGYEKGPYVVFNGNYTSPEVCLERAYQCVFAGTFPTHYWQGAAWNVIVPDVTELAPEDRPRLDYYRHLQTLVEKYDLGNLIAGDKHSNAGFSLHNGKGQILYYVPKENDFLGLRLPSEVRGQTMSLTWFNPFDGTFSETTQQKIDQWPAVKVPGEDGFRILILDHPDPNQ